MNEEWTQDKKEFAELCMAAITLILTNHKRSESGDATTVFTFSSAEASQTFHRLLGDILCGSIKTNPNVQEVYERMRSLLEEIKTHIDLNVSFAALTGQGDLKGLILSEKIKSLLDLDDQRRKYARL